MGSQTWWFASIYRTVSSNTWKILEIYEDKTWNSESIIKANGLYNSMINTQFSMSLIVCNNSINFIENLTNALQGRLIDTYKATQDIQSVIKGIQVCRDIIDEVQLEWNEEASHLLSYSNEGISLPRLNKDTCFIIWIVFKKK